MPRADEGLRNRFEWGKAHNMKFLTKKCKVLRISNKHSKLEPDPRVLFGDRF